MSSRKFLSYLEYAIKDSFFQISQWNDNNSIVIGVYQPNYTGDENGQLILWDRVKIKWQTQDGKQPYDRSKECSILTDFATAMNLECEHAISLAFVAGFGSLFVIVLLIFIILKRRYVNKLLYLSGIELSHFTLKKL